ncbi:succinyl-CoA synthetase (ADP-forming) beta subunit [Candidatus Kryptonium thompsonii]|uniref:Succinate--CoA ligase [ADP-forming] subunit beta n=1 Tax=Candidatus Kryptonium thompsonii TaxID=1633631 RepID=A0A0P1LXF3_9BACT|nr:ADP-forming succinate--CoA ligase subunit beta [Candidatus Kryptonium thompsoni]CUS78284.1 succinyl-CoA synthetase (ADP-forming) beta subunit [Candidatus Kryptonium thompsoni]CUS78480.1 succinyl-CoA synthetase (ADP-forming) beta subunit [Candidatus Kryptonium thompsoni]CUS80209.1 succinyl-CoA synthetase (ADP-forming) beta subunit [Candidatus Kryptonium thompsoni]CUS86411.1 succinyl-CoA synthetase (ADP-forming) beta subunit [Candidatus Kryptonium thompsoni]CUS86797.1 succinyl-CoA synthetase 
MKIHEYQAKEILKKFGVAVPKGRVAFTPEEAVEVAKEIGGNVWVVKAQIHAGGRGKAGGIKLARSYDEVYEHAKNMLGAKLVTYQTGPEGKIVKKVLVEQGLSIQKELYVGITLDRSTSRNVVMVSSEGGVEIEQIAAESPEKILKEYVDPKVGFMPYQARRLAFGLGLDGEAFKNAVKFLLALYKAYEETDASLAEINPLVLTTDGQVLALDAKMNFDDNALFRHPEIVEMRDIDEEDPLEVEASKYNLNYIRLKGNVGCMVNGAGLAMATMDLIKLAGGEPANFLDVGGGAKAETVEQGFRIILSDPNVKAILINIFGGIVRCDRVAQGVVEAARKVGVNVPVVVRLEGTNAEEGAKILKESGLNFIVANGFKDAAEKVVNVLKELGIN